MNHSVSTLQIIAEAGTNHGGDLQRAKQLSEIAFAAKADYVKYQIIYPEGLYLPKFFQNDHYEDNQVFHSRTKGMLTDAEYQLLAQHCTELGIAFSASVFDERGVDLLCELNSPFIKIASCDLNNTQLLRYAAQTRKKLIISTGMSSLADVDVAANAVIQAGGVDIVLMHCVSVYPADLPIMNLRFITTLKTAFDFPVGLSDHTESSLAGAIAVSLGATWIEKHFTYDRKAEGFDHAYAMEADPFQAYIADLRAAEQACHPSAIKCGSQELEVRKRARRALYAARDLEAGHLLQAEDILSVRPEGPLSPIDFDQVVGTRLSSSVRQYQPFSRANLE